MRKPKYKVMNNYADALKRVLIARSIGMITPAADELLSRIIYNVARFSWCDMLYDGKLNPITANSEDFENDVVAAVCIAANKADLTKSGTEIFVFLKTAAQNYIRNRIRDLSTLKRRMPDAETIAINANMESVADLYGESKRINTVTKRNTNNVIR